MITISGRKEIHSLIISDYEVANYELIHKKNHLFIYLFFKDWNSSTTVVHRRIGPRHATRVSFLCK